MGLLFKDLHLSLMKAKYGKNGVFQSPYDSRDYKFKDLVPMGAIKIPDNYETPLPDNFEPFDQGSSSMCAAASMCMLRYLQEIDQSEIDQKFSPAFTYANRIAGEDFEGMYIRSVFKKAREGVVPYSELPGFYSYPVCKAKLSSRKDELLEKASNFKIDSFYTCNSRAEIQTAIMETKAVITGIPIFKSFYKPVNGYVKYNRLTDRKSSGGHAVTLIGWKTVDGKLYWKLLNSWGNYPGSLNGIVWLPEAYPFLDKCYAAVDNSIETKWEEYKSKYNK